MQIFLCSYEESLLMKFEKIGLIEPILRAVQAEGYLYPTPIQEKAIPKVMEGRDLIGCAQTGTGKTAAFAMPTLQRLCQSQGNYSQDKGPQEGESKKSYRRRVRAQDDRKIRALILSPTRELTAQIGDSFAAYGRYTGLRHTVIYGGVSQHRQVRALQRGVDTLVATPGRLLDLINQGYIDISAVEILILDEADRMLDMGFIHDLRRIVACVPSKRQTLMFSATMPQEIRELAAQWLSDPIHVQVAPDAQPAEKVEQSVYFVEPRQKSRLLASFLHNTPSTRTLVFSRTKHGADKIVRNLNREGIQAAAIHGNKSQAARQRVLAQFKSDRLPVLIATDIAARGLDVDDISHVINYDMPHDAETYVHRIGRTGRAGAEGIAVSFCGRDERPHLRSVERLIRNTLTVEKHEYTQGSEQAPSQSPNAPKGPKSAQRKSQSFRKGRPKSKGGFKKDGRKASKPKAGRPKASKTRSGKPKAKRSKARAAN